MSTRKHFTKEEKIEALYKFSKKVPFDEIFTSNTSQDKKYGAKMIAKWRGELYKNQISLLNLAEYSNNLFFLQTETESEDVILKSYSDKL